MHQSPLIRQRLAVVFLAGFFLLFSPILALVDHGRLWFGLPVIYLWLFGVWALLILVSAVILETTGK